MSLVLTRLQDLRANSVLDKNMVRPNQFGALDYFVSQQGSLVDEKKKEAIFASIGRDVKLPVLDYNGTVQVSNTRSCTINDAENTSKLYDVVFKTYQVGVSMVPTLYMNNEIGYQKDFERKMLDAIRALGNALDQDAITAIAAAKTQVINEALGYTMTGNSVQVPYDNRIDILGDLDAMMSSNGYNKKISVVGNYGIQALVAKLAQLGPQNGINKTNEYAGKDFFTSINISNASGKYGTFYAIENGNVDVLTRVDRESLRNGKANGHEWTVAFLPGLDLPVGVHFYTEVGDQSAIAGDASADMGCVVSERWGISVDVAFITAYNSAPATKANPFIMGEIATGTGTGLPVNVTGQGA